MFKNPNRPIPIRTFLNRTFLLCILFIGTCSSVFAIDFSQALTQAQEKSVGLDTLFQGKSTVSNLFSKSLKIVKDKEISATTISFDQLKAYYSSDCNNITSADFSNILYTTNNSFKTTFKQLLPKGTKLPTTSDINTSYKKFFDCKKIEIPTVTDEKMLNTEINKLYHDGYANSYMLSNISDDNFGSEILWNGTLDDSPDFDLLYDINQIGKMLFNEFKDSPQILFYRLPESSQGSSQDGSSSSSDQGGYQLGGGGSSFPGTTGVPTSPSSASGSTTITTTNLSFQSSVNTTESPVISNKEIQNFIENTNPTVPTSTAGAAALVFGNQCLSSDISTPSEETVPLMTSVEYISGITDFITNANIDEVINKRLLTTFTTTYPLPPGGSTSDPGYASGVANAYAEQTFGDAAPGTCEYGCRDLPLDEQVQCELQCAGSCIQQCTDTSKTDSSSCSTNYTDDNLACDAISTSASTCTTNYTNKMASCNEFSDSVCDANYTIAISSCASQPAGALRSICEAQAFTQKTSCLVAVPVKTAACKAKAVTNKTTCLANVVLSPAKKPICKAKALAQKTACINQTVTDLRLCVSDCTCFLIAGPNGLGWEKVEDMYRIKFCKVPVQKTSVSPGKKVFSIQAIFQEISDVLEGLRDSGEMVKFSKTKEFLDGNVKINLADNFAFKILVGFKPLFPQRSTTTITKEQEQDTKDFSLGIMNMNLSDPKADNPNKYIVVSDYVKNKANLEPATSLSEINANIAIMSKAAEDANKKLIDSKTLQTLTKNYASDTSTVFVQNMIEFLKNNQLFRNNMATTLLDMTQMSVTLKEKIEKSK